MVAQFTSTKFPRLERHGFYPAGGDRFEVEIRPVEKLNPLNLLERGETKSRSARAIISNLSRNVADRELKVVADKLGWSRECLHVEEIPSNGPGNALILELGFENTPSPGSWKSFDPLQRDWEDI